MILLEIVQNDKKRAKKTEKQKERQKKLITLSSDENDEVIFVG